MEQPPAGAEGDAAEVTQRLEFLLATRIRYELHQRAPAPPLARAPELEAEPACVDPEQALRSAEFLLATRALRESNERAVRRGEATAAGSSDAPSP